MRNYKKRNQAYFVAAGFVALLLILLLSFSLGWFGNKTVERAEVQDKREIPLPDGSFVQLNAESQVSFNEKTFAEKRIIELKGEALFAVKRGAPFVVKTDYGYIRSTFGQFGVYSRPDGFDVSSFLSKVEIIKDEVRFTLENNEQAVWKDGLFEKVPNYNDRPDWTYLETIFREEPLSKAIDELERQYGIKVELDITGNPPYSGGLPHNDIQQAVDNLVNPYGYRYEQNGRILKIWEP